MKTRYYLLIAVLSYLLFTLVNTPAATVLTLAEKNLNMPAKLYGIDGTIWNGRADSLVIPRQPRIENVTWSVKPLSLFLASLSADVSALVKGQNVIATVKLGPTGTLQLSDLRSRLSAELVQQLINMPFGELSGEFNLDIKSLKLSNQQLPEITGQIKWKSATLTLAETVNLGHLDINIKPDADNKLLAKIKNTKGDIDVQGNIVIQPDKQYSIDISLVP